jgi:restriction endonuclease Mrr
MAIPDYEELMLPVLRVAGDGQEHRIGDVIEQLAKEFRLNDEERNQLLPSGKQTTFANRVHWARGYLCSSRAFRGNQKGALSDHRSRSQGPVREANTLTMTTCPNSQSSSSFLVDPVDRNLHRSQPMNCPLKLANDRSKQLHNPKPLTNYSERR